VTPGDLIVSAPGAQVQEVFLTEKPIFLLHFPPAAGNAKSK
jgi:UDP-N-acetylglucosamine:LPS N-acetylglucosamine transferase